MNTPNKQAELEKELNKLVRLGMLKKSKKGWQDSDLCKKIDLSKPREAFLIGMDKGIKETKAQALADVMKIIDERIKLCYSNKLYPEGKGWNNIAGDTLIKLKAKLQEQKV